MAGVVTVYENLVTSEHRDKTNFLAMVAKTCQPSADITALYNSIPLLFDVDTSTGQQLDVVGQWVGISRYLSIPLTGVYFALDTLGVGFNEGVWKGPYDSASGLASLPDDYYRLMIKMDILNNMWNGSIEDAYLVAQTVFGPLGYQIFIIDPSNLTMKLGIIGSTVPSAIIKALLANGDLEIKPIGVRITEFVYQSISGPLFAFDLNTAYFAGFNTGGWATLISH